MAQFQVVPVNTQAELKQWVNFPYQLYAHDKTYVPQIISDEMDFFSEKNPVFKCATITYWLAIDDSGSVVGRICSHILDLEKKRLNFARARFGWFECQQNYEIAKVLLDAVKSWAVEKACFELIGPYGFTDLDPEGLLIEGFNELPTVSASYNPPYYQEFLERWGLVKEVDYLEFHLTLPSEMPRLFSAVEARSNKQGIYQVRNFKSKAELKAFSGQFWELLESSFANLYGVVPMTQAQKDFYQSKYFGYLDPSFVHVATHKPSGQAVGFFVTMPSLSKGFQAAKGRLLPFGVFPILKNMFFPQGVDFLLAGVIPGHPASVIAVAMAASVYRHLKQKKIKWIETNHELETNTSVAQIWSHFEHRQHRRTRVYKVALP